MAKIPAEAFEVRDTQIEVERNFRLGKHRALGASIKRHHDALKGLSDHLGYDIGEMDQGFGAK